MLRALQVELTYQISKGPTLSKQKADVFRVLIVVLSVTMREMKHIILSLRKNAVGPSILKVWSLEASYTQLQRKLNTLVLGEYPKCRGS